MVLKTELITNHLDVRSEVLAVTHLGIRMESSKKFLGPLKSRVSVHLLQLLDCIADNFLNLEKEESVLSEELSCEVFVLTVIHREV